MRFKRLLALLLAAALALSLLAGCGGGKSQSLSQMLLNLLDGQYQNVSVEIDSDLETKLRQAISQSETDEELRAALEQLLGGGISFQRLGSGQQGDSAWTLIIYPGTDPNAAARSVYLDLDKVFAALPDDGVYSSGFAMAEMENGYAILVKATVDKAGTEDKPDPVTLKSIKVTKNPKLEYWVGESFNPAGMEITATYSNNTTKTLKDIKKNGDQGVKWTPETFDSDGTKTVTISYGEKNTTVSVTVKEPEVEKIEVSGPTNTIYTPGDLFSPAGMVITATYTDDHKETITNIINYGDHDVTWEPTTIAADTEKVTIKYQGKEAEVTITLTPPTLEGIKVDWSTEATYYTGDSIGKSGIATVTADYSYGGDKTLNPNEYKLTIKGPGDAASTEITDENPYEFPAVGSYTLTVTYTEGTITKTDTITITVVDKGYTVSEDGKTYTVTSADGLKNVAKLVNEEGKTDINITLDTDLTLTGEWTPIGSGFSSNTSYQGTFDGGGHTIKGLTITTSSPGGQNATLFDYIGSGGTVKNLQVEVNYNVQQNGAAGGIAYTNYGTITACSVTGNITASSGAIGGIAVNNFDTGTITACWFDGDLTTDFDNGGIAAYNYGTITACYYGGNSGHGANNQGGTVEATKVNDGDSWQTAVDGMNAALQSAGSKWRYELTGGLPTLKKQ